MLSSEQVIPGISLSAPRPSPPVFFHSPMSDQQQQQQRGHPLTRCPHWAPVATPANTSSRGERLSNGLLFVPRLRAPSFVSASRRAARK